MMMLVITLFSFHAFPFEAKNCIRDVCSAILHFIWLRSRGGKRVAWVPHPKKKNSFIFFSSFFFIHEYKSLHPPPSSYTIFECSCARLEKFTFFFANSTLLGVKSFAIYYTYNLNVRGVVPYIRIWISCSESISIFYIDFFLILYVFTYLLFIFKSYFMYVFILRSIVKGIWKWGYDIARRKKSSEIRFEACGKIHICWRREILNVKRKFM